MPREIHYKQGSGHYVIDARCPEHTYKPMKFDEIFSDMDDGVVWLNLHCPVCCRPHKITLTTES